jgi:hypothetical protein
MANETETSTTGTTDATSAQETAAEAATTAVAQQEAATAPAVPVQTVPFDRFRAVVGQRAEREAQLQEARRQLELANATIEEFKRLSEASSAPQGDGSAAVAPARTQSPVKVPTPAEIETLVAQEAARRDFTRQCNEAFASGKAAHADFEKVIADLNALSPVFDPRLQRPVMPQSLVEAALATGSAHEVLYALGKDNALADRVLSLSPLQQAAELTRLSLKLADASSEAASGDTGAGDTAGAAAPVQVSRAPAPVRPKVTGSGSTAPVWDPAATDKFSTEEWIARREADLKRAREATRH